MTARMEAMEAELKEMRVQMGQHGSQLHAGECCHEQCGKDIGYGSQAYEKLAGDCQEEAYSGGPGKQARYDTCMKDEQAKQDFCCAEGTYDAGKCEELLE